MPLPTSGPLKMSVVNTELKLTALSRQNLGSAIVRALAKKSSGKISYSDLRGKSSDVAPLYVTISCTRTHFNAPGQTAAVTFTLSAPAANWSYPRLRFSGFTASDFGGSGQTFFCKITALADQTTGGNIIAPSGVFTDFAGNENEHASLFISMDTEDKPVVPSDTTNPYVTINSTITSFTSDSTPATVTFTLSETPVSPFTLAMVTFEGVYVSGTLSGSGKVYTCTIYARSQWNSNAYIRVGPDKFYDAAGNGNSASVHDLTVNTVPQDATKPTVSITCTPPSFNQVEAGFVSIIFSEDVYGFSASDVTVTGGSITGFAQGTQKSYSFNFTPLANRSTPGSISVPANAATDSAGNGNVAATLSIPINTVPVPTDTTPPTVTVTSTRSSLTAGQTAIITFSLSESSTNFTASDVSVTGGSLSGFSGSGSSYQATFTPTANSTANGVVTVPSGSFTDAAGNGNTTGSVTMSINTVPADTTKPSISITSNRSSLSIGQTADITFYTSEPAALTFTQSDVSVTGGNLSSWSSSADGQTHYAIFTPFTNSTANGVISVPAGVFSDSAGNTNTAGSLTISVNTVVADTTRPSVQVNSSLSTFTTVQPGFVSIVFSEPVTGFSMSGVSATGGTLTNFAGSSSSYAVEFVPNANTFTTGTISVAANSAYDAAGNGNTAGSTTVSIDTRPTDTTGPTTSMSSSKSSVVKGETATIFITTSEPAVGLSGGDISVNGGSISGFSGSGTNYTATFTPETERNNPATVWINPNTYTDAAGNSNTGNASVTINVNTVTPPAVQPIVVNADGDDVQYDTYIQSQPVYMRPIATPSGGDGVYTYSWIFLSNPDSMTIAGAASRNPTVTKQAPKTAMDNYTATLRVTVTDSGGRTASEDVTVNASWSGN